MTPKTKKTNSDENEEDDNEADMNNNDTTLYDKDGGIIMNDIPKAYHELNIPTTVGYFRMGGRHEVFGFYIKLARPFKKSRKKLGIISVLCAKALDGTNYDQWKWVNCARVITNNTTKLLFHLENNHSDVASVKVLVRNNKKKGLVASVLETVQSFGSSTNTCAP